MPDNYLIKATGHRLTSLDALRGFTMFWIIGGDKIFRGFAKIWENPLTEMLELQMKHAGWEGFQFLDLIAPLFLFLVGVVLPFSVGRRVEQGADRKILYLHIAKRSAVLILLGLINYGLLRFEWPQMRWSSVLGRIGICYFFAALLLIHTSWRTQAIVGFSIMILFWAAVIFIPVPGYGPGVLTPEGCLTTYIDQLIMPGKLGLKLYDRQGILSTFTSLSTALMGVLAGHWLRSSRSGNRKAAGLLIAGLISLLVGHIWGKFFFVSRNIWTSSFVLLAGGWSLLLLALFYWVIDVRGYKKWSFFLVVIGMNAIAIWVGQRYFDFNYTAKFFFGGALKYMGVAQPIVLALCIVMVKWMVLWFLYRKKIFFKA